MKRMISRLHRRLTKGSRVRAIIHRCLKCGYRWTGRERTRPRKCPSCLSDTWDQITVKWGGAEPHRRALD